MNTSSEFEYEEPRTMSGFLPITLLGVSLTLVLIFQTSALLTQRTALQQALTQGETGVQQSKQVQDALQRIVTDVYTAAPEDKDAQAIITKYGIQMRPGVNAPAAPAESPASK